MTIDEAISHAMEVAEDNETKARRIGQQYEGTLLDRDAKECRECAADHRQLAEWLRELKEAKRLLKSAAKITKNLPCDDGNCSECVHNDNGYVCSEYEYFEWQYADEALKLIGEDEDANT